MEDKKLMQQLERDAANRPVSFQDVQQAKPVLLERTQSAVEDGNITAKQGRQVQKDLDNPEAIQKSINKIDPNKKGKESIKDSFLGALTLFAPQAIGMAIGGIFGGTEGAVEGGKHGAAAGQLLRDTQQQDLDNQLKQDEFALKSQSIEQKQQAAANGIFKAQQTQFINKKTNAPAIFDTKSGIFIDTETREPVQGSNLVSLTQGRANVRNDRSLDRISLSKERIGLRSDSNQLSRDRFQNKLGEQDELSNKQTEEISSLDAGLTLVEEIASTKEGVETGIFDSAAQSALEIADKASPEFTRLKAQVGNQLALFVKSISGAAVSEEEAQRLAKIAPKITDNNKTFKVKLQTFKRALQRVKESKLNAAKKFQGKESKGSPKKAAPKKQKKSDNLESILFG